MPLPAPADLDKPADFVEKMKAALDRANALLGGTDAMRAKGETYLPRFAGEAAETYTFRLKRAVLNNFFDAMAGQMVGMMFEKPVTFDKKSQIPEEILANLDKRGSDINAIAADLAKSLLQRGRPHILVDHPKKPEGVQTLADDKKHGLRPYWVAMDPGALLFAWADTENGEEKLGQIRWRELGSVKDGYTAKNVERIRVLDRDANDAIRFEKWERERDTDQFELKDSGVLQAGANKELADIPFVTLYSDRVSFMVSKPTLDDIAHKNIEHWQSSSDQRHILTVTRFPILYQLGTTAPVALVGPYSMFHTSALKNDVEIGYAEAEGVGLEHGWKDLDRIMAEAESMGLRIMVSDGAKSDSGEKVDFSKEGSRLQKLAVELERGLNQALIYTARWLGLPDEAAGTVLVHKDFGLSADDAKAIDQLIALRAAGDLSQPTLWAEVRERALFRTKFDPKKEKLLIDDEKQLNMERAALLLTPPPANDDEDAPPKEDDEDGDPAKKKPEAA
jgi:hypothetical protein